MKFRATAVRDVAFGVVSAAVALWLVFFAGPGTVEIATLAAVLVALIWFATVDPARLVDDRGRPQFMLFALAALGGGLLLTAAAIIGSGTTLIALAAGVTAIVTGLVRAVRAGLPETTEER